MERTKCTYCGTETNNQPTGDGCHACSRGIMAPVEDDSDTRTDRDDDRPDWW